jgi:c-di-GMP phosphodiesterase
MSTTKDHSLTADSPSQVGIFFTRQPILDKQRRIWGYELLGAELREGIFNVFSQQESSASLASTAYLGLQGAIERGKKVAVAFDAKSILDGVPHALPPGHGVLRVLAGAARQPEVLETLQAMRKQGYLVAIDLEPDNVDHGLCGQADILVQDFAAAKVNGLAEQAARTKTELLVRGVQSIEQFEKARDMGFTFYQGGFFKEPEPMPGRKLSSSHVSRINLFQLMESEDPDFKKLATAIGSDVSISFRLLSYLNSAFFGLTRKIQSIDQAIALLGWNKLKTWLRAVIITDMAGQEEVPQELAALSLQRAKFLELLSTEYDWWGFQPASLFLVGIFSLLDVILGMQMTDLAEKLPLDPKLKAALRLDANSEYLPLFHLLCSLEDGDWRSLETQARQLGLDLEQVRSFHARARDWSEAFFSMQNKT